MKVYKIVGSASTDGYRESIMLYSNMKEAPSSYVGHGKRINKQWIGELREGVFYGSFEKYVTDPEDILAAREAVMGAVAEYNLNLYRRYKATIIEIADHSLTDKVRIKDHKGDLVEL